MQTSPERMGIGEHLTGRRARRHACTLRLAFGLAVAAAAGCYGSGGNTGNAHGTPPAGAAEAGAPPPGSASGDVGPMSFRGLTVSEYQNTVRDLFGDPTLVVTLPSDPTGAAGFAEAPGQSDGYADSLRLQAEAIAASAVKSFDSLIGCDYTHVGDDACEQQFISRFLRRAYRKSVEATESAALYTLYQNARSSTGLGYGLKDATRVVIEAVLQSPRFLYHWERAPTIAPVGDALALSSDELASRLSYFLWSTMPDDALFAAADGNALTSDDDVGAQVIRMMGDTRFQQSLNAFHLQWLSLDSPVQKDPGLFPQFDNALQQGMIEETERFLHYVFFEGDGRFATLLGSSVADVDAPLAQIYGVPNPPTNGTARVTLDPTKRAGLLTRAALIAASTNASSTVPPRIGLLLWANVMCNSIGPPPPGAQAAFVFDPSKSTRENFATLQTQPACQSCHTLLNPLGFSFEVYDEIGAYRTTEGSHPIDASGVFAINSQPFSSIVDLSKMLGSDPDANKCMATNWTQYALARVKVAADAPSFDAAFAQNSSPSLDIRGFLRAMALSATFRNRAMADGEVSQ